MQLLFTTSNSALSRAIRRATRDPVSHVAILYKGEVLHSNLFGVHQELLTTFMAQAQVVYSVDVLGDIAVWDKLRAFEGAKYDFGALLYLWLRSLSPLSRILPKKNLWQSTGMFMCTEWATEVLYGKENSMITPYQLYLSLTKEK